MSFGSLGRLGVEIYADTATFTSDLGKAERSAKAFSQNIEASFGKIAGIFTGLAASIGAISFANTINDVAKMRAGLDDLADAGLGTVESLSRIKNSAKAFGADFDGLTGSFSKMINGLAGSEKETSKAGEALRRLGINARDSAGNLRAPAEVFEQLAVELAKYKDGADKAAYVQAILGKGAERYLPLLKDMAEEGAKNATVTAEQAAEADKYEKSMRALGKAMEGSKNKIAGEFIPAVTALAQVFTDLLTANDNLKKGVSSLAADGTIKDWGYKAGLALAYVVDAGDGVVRVFELIGKKIGHLAFETANSAKVFMGAAQMANPATMVQGFNLMQEGMNALRSGANLFAEDFEKTMARAQFSDAYIAKFNENAKKLRAAVWDPNEGGAFNFGDGKKSLDSTGFGLTDKDNKEKVSAYAKAIEDAQKRMSAAYAEMLDPLNNLTAAEKALATLRGSNDWEAMTTRERTNVRVRYEEVAAIEKQIAGQREWNKEAEDAKKYAADYEKSLKSQIDALDKQSEALRLEIENYGKLPSEIAAVTLAKDEETLATLKLNGASEDLITHQENVIKKQRQIVDLLRKKEGNQAIEQMARAWESVAEAGGRFFADLVMNGRSAFDRLKDSLKSFAAELIALFAKRWILNIAGNMTGGSMGQQLLSLGANAGNGSTAGSLLNLFGSSAGIWGSSAAYGAALGTTSIGAGSQAALLASQTAEFGAAGLSATASAAGGAAGSATSMLATAGPYIAFAVAAYALYQAFKSKGGPKEGGGFFGNFSDSGSLLRGSRGEWYGGVDTNNAGVQSLVGNTGLTLAQLIGRFGGTTTGFGIQLGYDSDPKGTAPNRLRSGLYDVSGQQIYGANYDFARGDPSAQLQLEMSRLLVAGLRASNINEELKKLFNSVDLSSATQQQIDDLMKNAEDLNYVLQGLATGGLGKTTIEAIRSLRGEGETLSQTFDRVSKGFAAINVVGATQVDETKKWEKQLNDLFGTIGVGVPQSVDDWRALTATIDLSTESGRSLFNVMAQGAGTFQQLQAAVSQAIAGIWASAQSALGGQFAATFARSKLQSTYAQWQAMRGENFSWEEMLQHFSSFTPETLAQGIQATREQYGAPGVALLNQLWADYSAYIAAMGQSSQTVTTAFTNVAGSVDNFAEQMEGVRAGLADYLRGLNQSDLSPLSPMAKYAEARRVFYEQLGLAQGGNIDALSNIQGYHQSFLQASRGIFASSGQYNSDYFSSYNELAGLTGGLVGPLTNAQFSAGNAALIQELQAMRNAPTADSAVVVDAIVALAGVVIEKAATGDVGTQARIDTLIATLQRLGPNTALTNTAGALA